MKIDGSSGSMELLPRRSVSPSSDSKEEEDKPKPDSSK
jgi:hypothetical protein